MGYFHGDCSICKRTGMHALVAVMRNEKKKRVWQVRCPRCQNLVNLCRENGQYLFDGSPDLPQSTNFYRAGPSKSHYVGTRYSAIRSRRPDILPTIRLLNPDDDIAALTQLLHRAYRLLAERGMNFIAATQDEQMTRQRAAGGECYLAFHGTSLIGTITLTDIQNTFGSPWLDRPDVACFGQFAVDPAFQKLGIGSRLIRHVEQRAAEKQIAELAIDTAEPATHLHQYYAAHGYRFIEHVKWASQNYRSVVMSKRIVG